MSSPRDLLAIESSCDDTSVSIVSEDGFVKGVVSANQDLVHKPFGGVVPEIASRSHTEALLPLIELIFEKTNTSKKTIAGIAVTSEPGLVGSLMVGVVTAKNLANMLELPIIGVNHIEGHLLAPLLRDSEWQCPEGFGFPYLALAVSGGHSSLFVVKGPLEYVEVGATIDDAAGEAFDKFAKMLGLGYPGGVLVDKLAVRGDKTKFKFPKPLNEAGNLNFSFSGLKSAAHRLLSSMSSEEIETNKIGLCASYQHAIVSSLMEKLSRAQLKFELKNIAITGGVSANSSLREQGLAWAKKNNLIISIPPSRYCTDNAAMIGLAGWYRFKAGKLSDMYLAPSAVSTSTSGFIKYV